MRAVTLVGGPGVGSRTRVYFHLGGPIEVPGDGGPIEVPGDACQAFLLSSAEQIALRAASRSVGLDG